MFNGTTLLASLLWGSIGLGYFIYGKKQGSWAPLAGGISMIATSYFAGSVVVMSIVCAALMGFVYYVLKRLD